MAVCLNAEYNTTSRYQFIIILLFAYAPHHGAEYYMLEAPRYGAEHRMVVCCMVGLGSTWWEPGPRGIGRYAYVLGAQLPAGPQMLFLKRVSCSATYREKY